MKRRGVETVLILGAATLQRDATLINAIAKAHVWMRAWHDGSSLSDIAKSIGWTPSPLRQRLKLAFPSPAINRRHEKARQWRAFRQLSRSGLHVRGWVAVSSD